MRLYRNITLPLRQKQVKRHRTCFFEQNKGVKSQIRASGTNIAVALQWTEFVQEHRRKMSKTNNIIGLLEAGIRAEGLRQRAIANNVANIGTPGYRSLDVKFEKLLAKALQSQQGLEGDEVEAEI